MVAVYTRKEVNKVFAQDVENVKLLLEEKMQAVPSKGCRKAQTSSRRYP